MRHASHASHSRDFPAQATLPPPPLPQSPSAMPSSHAFPASSLTAASNSHSTLCFCVHPVLHSSSASSFLCHRPLTLSTNSKAPPLSNCRLPLVMKSKKRSRPTTTRDTDSATNSTQAPARINVDNTTLSVRKQLQLVRRFNDLQSHDDQRSKPVQRTSFRRPKVVATTEHRRRRIAASTRQTDIPDGKYALDTDPLMYVDGYNVIGAWPRLRKWRDRDDLHHARRLLLDDVAEFSAVRGWECVVVFDAGGNDMAGERTDQADSGIAIVYTGSETADSYIERQVFEQCRQGERQIWATTSDLVQARVAGAIGAHVMSSSLFIQELKRTKKETEEALAAPDGAAYRAGMLMSNVDADTLRQLYRLRDGEG